ncbi:MAG TPA: hypothetical protein VGH83_01095 [Candidatus Acidoferrum sp.]|jgi:hypothetical protein
MTNTREEEQRRHTAQQQPTGMQKQQQATETVQEAEEPKREPVAPVGMKPNQLVHLPPIKQATSKEEEAAAEAEAQKQDE